MAVIPTAENCFSVFQIICKRDDVDVTLATNFYVGQCVVLYPTANGIWCRADEGGELLL